MRRWTYGLGGLWVWALHFGGIYAIASLDAVTPADDRAAWQAAATAFSLACAAGCLGLLALAGRRLKRPSEGAVRLMDQFAALGAGLGLVAVAWQAASPLIV